jgi:shikimate kinase
LRRNSLVERSNVALVGFMCAGKSAVGWRLASRLGKTFVETDSVIEGRAGISIAEIFSRWGEQRFRDLEADVVRDVVASTDSVIACGGGVVLRPENVACLKSGAVVVHLLVSADDVIERLGSPSDVRPLLSGSAREQRVTELLEYRGPFYSRAAELTVDTAGLSVDEVVERIVESLGEHEGTGTTE